MGIPTPLFHILSLDTTIKFLIQSFMTLQILYDICDIFLDPARHLILIRPSTQSTNSALSLKQCEFRKREKNVNTPTSTGTSQRLQHLMIQSWNLPC